MRAGVGTGRAGQAVEEPRGDPVAGAPLLGRAQQLRRAHDRAAEVAERGGDVI
ncbi:hypothetical protein RI687_01335 [Clavibacter michiganensis]|uniref:hypothetical protein n=1 Tax=Clavibacter michiganensis TaxID=28447 RepID=UPI003DA1B743